jgi:hypothetical protein
MSKFVGVVIGALEIVAGVLLLPVSAGLSSFLIASGVGMVLTGIGTLLQAGPLSGTSTLSRNPIAPWNVVYGRQKVGGTLVHISEFDEDNKYLDLVIVLACHPSEGNIVLLFDGQRVRLDGNGCSFEPTQQTISLVSVTRANGTVTAVLTSSITDLQTGDSLIIQNVSDATYNGRYAVTVVNSTTFTYICGGTAGTVSSSGQAVTVWPNYKAKVHMEVLLGDHTDTFPGMITGTPYDGDPGNLVIYPNNPWTADHRLLGRTSVFLRLHYNDEIFANGLPTIAFRLSGKKDIYDPRTSPATYGYTENPALIIADYLANTAWGFRAAYGTEIPLPELISAANVCDEAVTLAAGGTEPRYTCNGGFPLTVKRGEVLQNLLTACGGRLTYVQGQFVIHPAGWPGANYSIPPKPAVASATLSVITSHIVGGLAGYASARVTYTGYFFGTPYFFDVFNYTYRTSAHALSAGDLAGLMDGSLSALYSDENSIFADSTPADEMRIYDIWIDVIYADGSTGVLRATKVDEYPTGQGLIINSQRAIDGDPYSYCSIQTSQYRPLGQCPSIGITRFAVISTTGAPDVSTGGMVSSGQALTIAAGPFRWREKVAIRDLYNGVKGTYISPANNWQSSDIPPYAQDETHGYMSGSPMYPFGDANLAADGGERRWLDIQLPFTISVATAQRLCKIELLRRRQQGTGTFSYNMAMYKTTVLDIVQMTLPLLGWTNKFLEIAAHRFTINRRQVDGNDVTLLGTEIDVQETDIWVYDWSASEELTAAGFQQPSLPGSIDGGGSSLVSYTNYVNTPAIALSQPDATHIALAAVSVAFANKTVTYNARSISISDPGGTPTWYYVTIADPDFLGDPGVSTALAVYAETGTAKVGVEGYIYMGAIQCTHAAGATATALPGGWPAPQSFLVGS